MPPYDGWVSGMAICPLCRGVASSEAETSYLLEGGSLPSSEAEMRGAVEGPDGSPRARQRSPRGSEGVRMGRMLGFFESFPSFQIGRRPWAFVGSVA